MTGEEERREKKIVDRGRVKELNWREGGWVGGREGKRRERGVKGNGNGERLYQYGDTELFPDALQRSHIVPRCVWDSSKPFTLCRGLH